MDNFGNIPKHWYWYSFRCYDVISKWRWLKPEKLPFLIWQSFYSCVTCSGRRSSFHDRASGNKRRPVLQHRQQTRNNFKPGKRSVIRSAIGLIIIKTVLTLDKCQMHFLVSFKLFFYLFLFHTYTLHLNHTHCSESLNCCCFPQEFWSMDRPSETRWFHLMAQLTLTWGVLASSTRLWAWG